MRPGKTIAALAAMLALTACAGNRPMASGPFTESTFTAWDVDGDGVLEASEFEVGWTQSGRMAMWDTDGDGFVDETEFAAGTRGNTAFRPFAAWDADRDRRLDPLEFRTGAYEMWDNDRDTRISRAEWIRSVASWDP